MSKPQSAPLPFITLEEDPDTKQPTFVLHKEACDQIRAVKEPLYVVTIAGLYRTGKSFVMNQMAGCTTGFDIGYTVEPCTQGIWMWLVDSVKEDEQNPALSKKIKLLLLDTEGLGSYTKTETYDVQIFSFSLLLCSYFVYNSLGSIDETALDRLSLVIELSRHIQAEVHSENEGERDAYNLRVFFPEFLWLVRDFTLELSSGGKAISSNQYLENALRPHPGESAAIQGKNSIRKALVEFFPVRDCFTMKRPVDAEEKLHRLATLPRSEFRPEYLAQMEQLRKHIMKRVKPKTLFNYEVNGPMFIGLAESYVHAINNGGVPVIRTAWENVSESQTREAFESARKYYSTTMKEFIASKQILEHEEIELKHHDIFQKSIAVFRKSAVGDIMKEFQDKLEIALWEAYLDLQKDNKYKSLEECQQASEECIASLSTAVSSGALTTIDQLQEQIRISVARYERSARGPHKYKALSESLKSKPLDMAEKISNRQVEAASTKVKEEMKRALDQADNEYQRLHTLYNNIDMEYRRAQASLRELERERQNLFLQLTRASEWM